MLKVLGRFELEEMVEAIVGEERIGGVVGVVGRWLRIIGL